MAPASITITKSRYRQLPFPYGIADAHSAYAEGPQASGVPR